MTLENKIETEQLLYTLYQSDRDKISDKRIDDLPNVAQIRADAISDDFRLTRLEKQQEQDMQCGVQQNTFAEILGGDPTMLHQLQVSTIMSEREARNPRKNAAAVSYRDWQKGQVGMALRLGKMFLNQGDQTFFS